LPALLLTAQLRRRLKNPLGKLIIGPSEVVVEELRRHIEKHRPKKVICVGDAVSRLFSVNKLHNDVQVFDNVEMRQKLKPEKLNASRRIFLAKNRPGTIDMSSWQAINEAIEAGNAVVVVDGEEDLLALAAIALAPMNSVVVYGQPKVGVVLVVVDKKLKAEAHSILNSMRKT
jgi:uncharacterized protein (UPF0218 family)